MLVYINKLEKNVFNKNFISPIQYKYSEYSEIITT